VWTGTEGGTGRDAVEKERQGGGVDLSSDSYLDKKEIVWLGVGNEMTAGVDSEGELHLWGKKE